MPRALEIEAITLAAEGGVPPRIDLRHPVDTCGDSLVEPERGMCIELLYRLPEDVHPGQRWLLEVAPMGGRYRGAHAFMAGRQVPDTDPSAEQLAQAREMVRQARRGR
jgi:hypothetical protein